jgi:precorrin-6B methylase 2
MRQRPAAPMGIPRVYYRKPLFDRPLGRYTAEWEGPDGMVQLQTLNRLQDWEGNRPSLYSILRLPYVIRTYLQGRRSYILPKPVPFIVLDAIKRLGGIVRPGMNVLEIGGGNSTLWFLNQGCQVTTFDHDSAWAKSIEQAANGNERLQITVAMGDEAVKLVDGLPDQSFDLALVDSTGHIPAADCIPSVRKKLKKGGWLILDNSDMPANWRGAALMADRDRETYVGYPPMGLKVCQTSFWRV